MGKTKKNNVFIWMIFVSFIFSACSKPTVPSEETDWRNQYGTTINSIVTGNPEKPTATVEPTAKPTNKPGEIDFSSFELPFPTPLPVREFVPEDDQVELVLWMFESQEEFLDDHIVAELNHILQERGYAFYLTKKVEPEENRVGQISRWQEALDSGESVDLIFLGSEDGGMAYREYGNTAIVRAITGGYLLPFSEYPETEAKERLLSAYPEDYWRLCGFQGENYGVSNAVSNYCVKRKSYLMFNLDAAEEAGIEIPEELDVLNLDELLRQAEEAGIPGMDSMNEFDYCGIESLYSGLYVKNLQDGEYRIVNPVEDEELLALWDAQYRYKEKGWGEMDSYLTGEIPLILFASVTDENWDGERFFTNSEKGKLSARMKIYEEKERFLVEADYNEMLGIVSTSQHKEEALELLSLMHGDEEIVQLLRYGIEGVHYRIGEEGVEEVTTSEIEMHEGGISFSTKTKTWKIPGERKFGDHFGNTLMYVELDERFGRPNMEGEWYADMSDIELIPYVEEFNEEQKKVQEKIKEITFIVGKGGNGMSISNISSFLITLKPDYQDQIEKLRTAFAEAGYNELAKEVNKAHGLD